MGVASIGSVCDARRSSSTNGRRAVSHQGHAGAASCLDYDVSFPVMSPVSTPNEPEHSTHVRSIALTTIVFFVSNVSAYIDREMAAMRVMKNTTIVKVTMAVKSPLALILWGVVIYLGEIVFLRLFSLRWVHRFPRGCVGPQCHFSRGCADLLHNHHFPRGCVDFDGFPRVSHTFADYIKY